MSAEETLTALVEHVSTKYSFPLVNKSDNGTAFRIELMACKWYGGAERWPHYASIGETHSAVRELTVDVANGYVCVELY
eukprot:4233184-Pleurochrysis_carterae.AAC.1